ncbi:MAG TPA: hypothetical protein VGO28_13045 [Acidimicrobiia bacterium]|jgi:hypothetical protein
MGKAIQCPSCGRKHRVSGLPDAPTFQCENCGQPLKVPSQFRQAEMSSSRRERPSDAPRPESTSVLPAQPSPAKPSVAASAPAAARPAASLGSSAAAAQPDAIVLPLRILAWVVALFLGLVVTVWVARVTGWLSGDRLVDVFVGTGLARYIRVLAVAPVWALFTTLLLTSFLEGGRALARRRAEKRAATNGSRPDAPRGEGESFDGDDGFGAGDDGAAGWQRSKRAAAPRGGP